MGLSPGISILCVDVKFKSLGATLPIPNKTYKVRNNSAVTNKSVSAKNIQSKKSLVLSSYRNAKLLNKGKGLT
jgi:hypothetical protein